MYAIGLTGQIASGKSLAAETFKTLKISTLSADDINRQLLVPGTEAYQAIHAHFGDAMLLPNQTINKPALRRLITHSTTSRSWLEALMHPLIQHNLKQALADIKTGPYCVIEIPLLTNRQAYPYLDRVLFIESTPEVQLTRLMQRDGATLSEAEALLAIQPPLTTYQQIADDKIINDGLKSNFVKKIKNLHEQYLQYAAQKS